MKKQWIVLIPVFLVACTSATKIAIHGADANRAEEPLKYIVDDRKYYKNLHPPFFYPIADDQFSPNLIHDADAALAGILTSEFDAKSIRVKRFSIYLSQPKSLNGAVNPGVAAIIIGGGALGGAFAAAMAESDLSNSKSDEPFMTEKQSVGCNFLARYRGRLIEFHYSEPLCNAGESFCWKSDVLIYPPSQDAMIRNKAGVVAEACRKQVVEHIEKFRALPELAIDEQEIR